MAAFQTEALILRAVDFGESDRVLHLLVPDMGRLTAIAKGARRSVRRFPGTLDLFNQLRVQVHRGRSNAMARLEQASLIRSFAPLRLDSARFALGCYLLELLDRLAPEGGARADTRKLFSFALGALATVADHPVDARLRTLLELRALEALGLCPELRRCVRCGEDVGLGAGDVRFRVADGGPVCARCAPLMEGLLPVQLGTLRSLEQGLHFELDQLHRLALSPQILAEARGLVTRFQRFHVGVELRSERFLDEILGCAGVGAA
jgi:DNA repair protein RecO (recombination protein O)